MKVADGMNTFFFGMISRPQRSLSVLNFLEFIDVAWTKMFLSKTIGLPGHGF